MIKDAVISLSLANLCMVNMWRGLLYRAPSSPSNDYFLKSFSYRLAVSAAFLDVLLLGAAIFPLMILLGRKKGPASIVSRFLILALLFFPMYQMLLLGRSLSVGPDLSSGDMGTSFIIALCALLALYFLWDRTPRVESFIKNALFILSPFLLVTFVHAGWHAIEGERHFRQAACSRRAIRGCFSSRTLVRF